MNAQALMVVIHMCMRERITLGPCQHSWPCYRPPHSAQVEGFAYAARGFASNTQSVRPQPLWQPPPTTCLTASGAPPCLMHPLGGGGGGKVSAEWHYPEARRP